MEVFACSLMSLVVVTDEEEDKKEQTRKTVTKARSDRDESHVNVSRRVFLSRHVEVWLKFAPHNFSLSLSLLIPHCNLRSLICLQTAYMITF